MNSVSYTALSLPKSPTGIDGLDAITRGGLPQGRTTLIKGGPGSGKTVMALQILMHGVLNEDESAIFVAFEESARSIQTNSNGFGWHVEELSDRLFILEAQPTLDLLQSGEFDLGGLLAGLEAKVRNLGAKRIVFDALDVILRLLPDVVAVRREVYRLHQWLADHAITALVTVKAPLHEQPVAGELSLDFMEFMVDCAIHLNHTAIEGVSQRTLQVTKYRGSGFTENAAPFLIGPEGFDVAGPRYLHTRDSPIQDERLSSGIERLDTMLGGGYYRRASVLITGFPGTAKTSLCGTFAQSACENGERVLFISFDSETEELVRNLTSIKVQLAPYQSQGFLKFISARALTESAENHLLNIKKAARDHEATCLVVDPVSALAKSSSRGVAHSVVERLVDWGKSEGLTLVCSSLLDESSHQLEATPLQISTIADTWIHLSYTVNAGERNRGLSIIKSRGTRHSNQVRELILSNEGVTLADAYMAGGEVLMGTMRWEKEQEEAAAERREELLADQRKAALEHEEAELKARLQVLQLELDAKSAERQAHQDVQNRFRAEKTHERDRLAKLRGHDHP